MVAGLAFTGARRALLRLAPAACADPRRAALAAAWACAAAYAAATGFDVPVRRSLVFLSVACAAALARRPVHGSALVAAAALAVLAREPEALFDAGARLSFAAAAALVLARGPAPATGGAPADGWRSRAARALGASLRTSATALAASAPLAALHFGRVAPAALAANLAAVPLTGALILPASLAAAGATALAPGWPALAAGPAALTRSGGAALDAIAELATRGPGAERVVAPGPGALALSLACAAAALRVRGTAARLLAAALGHAALLLAPPPAALPAAPRAVVLDVGQGDATLVQGRRAALLVDAATALPEGPDLGRSVVRPALAALGASRLDLLAVTHADLDHRGGAQAVLESLPVERLWLPGGAREEPAFADLLASAARRGVAVATPARGDPPLALGDLRVEVLWPPPPSDAPAGLSDNDRSLVLRVEVAGGARVLLPGDVEAAGEAGLLAAPAALAADVLKLPHHGSRTSSGGAFLDAVGAAIAVASAPCLGRFGMPHPTVAARLAARGASLWWTGRDGAVAVGLARPLAARGFARSAPVRERARCGPPILHRKE
jgi:competence protein ComEC